MNIQFKHEIKLKDKITSQELLNIILFHRKIKDLDEFLNPVLPLKISLTDFNSKYKLYLIKVIKLLKEIKKNDQMIIVYTDYDADGITGGAILWETLYLLGFNVMPYVPHRKLEGYGFSKLGIDNVKKKFDPALIISVDHGITKIEEVKYAKKLGIKIIITDHHLKGEKIPKAEAIFHIPELSGSGVAYFFAKEIYLSLRGSRLSRETKQSQKKLQDNFSSDYLALAAIGTIADLVPLVGASRSIVKHGLEAFPKVKRWGLKHILREAGIEDKKITPYEVGFMIAPRINAVGRLEHAIDALRLLCTNDESKARRLSQKIGQTNSQRQDLVKKSVEEARLLLRSALGGEAISLKGIASSSPAQRDPPRDDINFPKIIILVSDKWHEGIIGLIASKIAEEFYRPTIVITKTEDGKYKGSARSIPGFDITKFLRSLKKYLVDIGGHPQAAGFTIDKKQIISFRATACKLIDKLIKDDDLEKKINADIKIPVSKINLSLVKSLETLEPYGIGNPRPTFYSEGILTYAQLLGKTNNHLKIFVKDIASSSPAQRDPPRDDITLELIAFNQADKFKSLSRGQKINIVYTLEIDRWGGREKLRGKLLAWLGNKYK